jgi:hypothetical protein
MVELLKIFAKITKVKDIREEYSKLSGRIRVPSSIQEGDSFNSYYYNEPIVGESFIFWSLIYGAITTTEVTEIINERTFRTKNSIYTIYKLEDERDDKINNILN